jgi:hypothetical protein
MVSPHASAVLHTLTFSRCCHPSLLPLSSGATPGNMQAAGLLQPSSGFIELGAGKGFLSAWLHQVCNAQDIILLDRLGNFAKKVRMRLLCTSAFVTWRMHVKLWVHAAGMPES